MTVRTTWRLLLCLSFALSAIVAGCKRTATTPAPVATPAPVKPAGPPAVAQLLGKPVTAEDCTSKDLGIDDRDQGFTRLVSLAIEDDFCKENNLKVTKDDVQAGLSKLNQGLKNKLGGAQVDELLAGLSPEEQEALKGLKDLAKLPSPESLVPYEPRKAADELEMVRFRLAQPNVTWLDRLVLQERQRAAQAMADNKAMQAGEVMRAAQTEKFHRAVYEKYNGRVVANKQLGVLPAEALHKLYKDYEQQGKLKIEDEQLKASFWTWAEERQQGEEVPEDQMDFVPKLLQGGGLPLPEGAADLLKGLQGQP